MENYDSVYKLSKCSDNFSKFTKYDLFSIFIIPNYFTTLSFN